METEQAYPSLDTSQVAPQARAYHPSFCGMKQRELFLLHPGWILVHHKVIPDIKFASTHNFIPLGYQSNDGSKGIFPSNTTQCPRPGFEAGLHLQYLSNLQIKK